MIHPDDPPPATAAPHRTGAWRAVRLAFSALVAAVLVVVAARAVDGLSSVSLRLDVPWLAAAYPLGIAAFPLLALAWAELLAAYGTRLPGRRAVRLWALAQASRYLPTGLAAVASRAVLAAREGVPAGLTVTTMVVEGALVVAWSAAAGLALVAAGTAATTAGPVAVAGVVAVIAIPSAAVAASRPRAGVVARLVARLSRRPDPARPGPMVMATLAVGANMAVKGAVFVLFARALLHVHGADVALLFGAVNLAVAAGMVGVTPAGLGVREGVLAALLSHRFGAADATALAVALRVWDLAVELPWVAVAALTGRTSRAPK